MFNRTTRHEILSCLGGPGKMFEEGESAIAKAEKGGVGGPMVELELEKGVCLVEEVDQVVVEVEGRREMAQAMVGGVVACGHDPTGRLVNGDM